MPINDLWQSFLEDKPEAAYFGYQNQWKSPNQKDYFKSQFSNIQNQYMGQLGQQIYSGGAPTQNWADFLKEHDWQQQFQGLTPQEKGTNYSRYNPFSKWLV